MVYPSKNLDFSKIFLLIEFCQIKQKVENGSCSRHSCVNRHDFKWMYDIPYESTHTQLWFRSKKNFKIQNSNFAYLWTNEPQNGYSALFTWQSLDFLLATYLPLLSCQRSYWMNPWFGSFLLLYCVTNFDKFCPDILKFYHYSTGCSLDYLGPRITSEHFGTICLILDKFGYVLEFLTF